MVTQELPDTTKSDLLYNNMNLECIPNYMVSLRCHAGLHTHKSEPTPYPSPERFSYLDINNNTVEIRYPSSIVNPRESTVNPM